ncbi:MAG: type II secretion system F family protein, partial [Candidatus Peregrinibacteria bacterium]
MPATQLHIGSTPLTSPIAVGAAKPVAKEESKGLVSQLNQILSRFTPIKTADKVSFFRLLATMINAGISIVKGLHILQDQIENQHFKEVIADLAKKIETGSSFSKALGDYRQYFTDAQIGMVEAGEASGRLNQTLLQIATETEKSASLTSKIKGAMIYPVVVLVILFGAGFAVMTFVMPKIKEMFENLGGELPAMTKVLIAASDFLVGTTLGLSNALWIIMVVVGLIFLFFAWKKTELGRLTWARILLRLPVFGKLSQRVALARFCRGLSTLVSSGVTILKALRITASSVGNTVYEHRINDIADDVRQGITMAENMKDDEAHFPSMVVGMIGVAEQTAQIDTITAKIADYYEEQVDDMVKNLSSLMEPIIIVVLGLAVAFLVIAVMM